MSSYGKSSILYVKDTEVIETNGEEVKHTRSVLLLCSETWKLSPAPLRRPTAVAISEKFSDQFLFLLGE